jgi:hypothetical protein
MQCAINRTDMNCQPGRYGNVDKAFDATHLMGTLFVSTSDFLEVSVSHNVDREIKSSRMVRVEHVRETHTLF